MELVPGVNYFDQAFHLTIRNLARLPNLHHKCSSHDDPRIGVLATGFVDIPSSLRGFFVETAPEGQQASKMDGLSSRFVERFVMQAQEVIGPESEGSVSLAMIIAEFHFEDFRTENLHNRAYLPADQAHLGHIAHQSNHGKDFQISHFTLFSIVHNSLSTSECRHPFG